MRRLRTQDLTGNAMGHIYRLGLTIAALAVSVVATGNPPDPPNDMAVDGKKAEFFAQLAAKFSDDERNQIIDACLVQTRSERHISSKPNSSLRPGNSMRA